MAIWISKTEAKRIQGYRGKQMEIDPQVLGQLMEKLDQLELIARETRTDLKNTREEQIELKVAAKFQHEAQEKRIDGMEKLQAEREARFNAELLKMDRLRTEITSLVAESRGKQAGRHEGALESKQTNVTVENKGDVSEQNIAQSIDSRKIKEE